MTLSGWYSMLECAGFRQDWLKIELAHYLCAMKTSVCTNWYYKATAPILMVLVTVELIKRHNVMELIQKRDNQNQQAKGFQMRCNLSNLNNWNYQTLIWPRWTSKIDGVPSRVQFLGFSTFHISWWCGTHVITHVFHFSYSTPLLIGLCGLSSTL